MNNSRKPKILLTKDAFRYLDENGDIFLLRGERIAERLYDATDNQGKVTVHVRFFKEVKSNAEIKPLIEEAGFSYLFNDDQVITQTCYIYYVYKPSKRPLSEIYKCKPPPHPLKIFLRKGLFQKDDFKNWQF